MIENKRQLHPILALVFSMIVFFFGLLHIKDTWFTSYFISLIIFYFIFQMGSVVIRVCLIAVPIIILAFFLTYINGTWQDATYMAYRFIAISLAAVLSISIAPIRFVRVLNQWKAPRWLSIGVLILFRFLNVFLLEIRRIINAIHMRRIYFHKQPILFARAFFLPLMIRVFQVSELLSVSLETRSFGMNTKASIYERVDFTPFDIIFAVLFIAIHFSFLLNNFPVGGIG